MVKNLKITKKMLIIKLESKLPKEARNQILIFMDLRTSELI